MQGPEEDTFDETALDSSSNNNNINNNKEGRSVACLVGKKNRFAVTTTTTTSTHDADLVAQRGGNNKARGLSSLCSQQYDIDGDGKLDDMEQDMRNMDSNNEMEYVISNEKVYQILQQQMKTQKDRLNLKRLVVIAFAAFALILALSKMMGTGFAAARFAKDTQVTTDGILVNKNDADQVVSTAHAESKILDLNSAGREVERRLLDLVDGDLTAVTSSDSLSFSDAEALYAHCISSSKTTSNIRHSCGDVTKTIPICGPDVSGSKQEKKTGPWPKTYTWTYRGGKVEIGGCTSAEVCAVVFSDSIFECGNPPAVTTSPVSPAPTPAPITPVPTPAPITPVPTPSPIIPTYHPVEVFLTPAPLATRPPR